MELSLPVMCQQPFAGVERGASIYGLMPEETTCTPDFSMYTPGTSPRSWPRTHTAMDPYQHGTNSQCL